MYDIDLFQISGVNINILNGVVNLNTRPTVNGSGVLLSGEVVNGGGNNNGGGGGTTLDNILFNGERAISRQTFPYNQNLSGSTGIVEFLNNVFFPPNSIQVSLQDFPIKESGTDYQVIFTGRIDPNDDTDVLLGTLYGVNLKDNSSMFVENNQIGRAHV